jgi:hypothetical protein
MLNPYVPGNAGTTTATANKKKPSANPMDDRATQPIRNPGGFGAPLVDQVATKPAAETQPVMPTVNPVSVSFGGASPAPSNAPRATTGIDIMTPAQMAEDRLNRMVDSNSTYMNQARREGLLAAAARGGLNTSIAGGMAAREAINKAAPIAMADADFTQRAFMQDRQGQIQDRLGANSSLRSMDEQDNQGRISDWLSGNEAGRRSAMLNQEADLANQRDVNQSILRRQEASFDFNLRDSLANNETQRAAWLNQATALSSAYVNSLTDVNRLNLDFISNLGQAFIDDPEVYSPEVVNGMTNFFRNLTSGSGNSALSQILRDMLAFGGVATQPVVQPTQPVRGTGG